LATANGVERIFRRGEVIIIIPDFSERNIYQNKSKRADAQRCLHQIRRSFICLMEIHFYE